jgi:hypothetical protein
MGNDLMNAAKQQKVKNTIYSRFVKFVELFKQ